MLFHYLKSSNLTSLLRGGAWHTPCKVFIEGFDLRNRSLLTLAAAGVSLVNLWVCWRQRWSVRCLLQRQDSWRFKEFLRFLVFLLYRDFHKQTSWKISELRLEVMISKLQKARNVFKDSITALDPVNTAPLHRICWLDPIILFRIVVPDRRTAFIHCWQAGLS